MIQSYLTNRTQYVAIDDTNSPPLPITCGVPQGSVLGPLLFLLYINDLHRVSSILFTILFADDTTLVASGHNLDLLVSETNQELCKIQNWISANKLSLNISKTNYIFFSKKANSLPDPISLNGCVIERKHSTKYLGVLINENLTWHDHILSIEKKLSCALGIICKARYKLTALASLLLYDSMFASNLNYCNLIWATTYDSLLARILNLQKRLLKFCIPKNQTYIMQGIPVEPMSQYHIFHKLTIYGMRNLQLAKFMYNTIYITPFPQFQPFLQRNETLYHYNTRNKQNFLLLFPQTYQK